MADFSRQWCIENDEDMMSDFDIMDEFEQIREGHYVGWICEGYGFIAIGNFGGECKLAFRTERDSIEWRDYNQVVKKIPR
jgi:hypothetical protein